MMYPNIYRILFFYGSMAHNKHDYEWAQNTDYVKIPTACLEGDRLCGLVVRVLGHRSGCPGSIPGTTRKEKKVVGLERGPLSLVSTTEELLDRKVAVPV
jgi:hypothetical protein